MLTRILLFLFPIFSAAVNYSNEIPKCSAGDDSCLAPAITELISKIPKFKLNRPVDPLFIGQFSMQHTGETPFQIKATFKDMRAYGLSTMMIRKVVGFGPNPRTSKFEVYGIIPQFTLIGNYKIDGNIYQLPIQGTGKCNFTVETAEVFIDFKPEVYEKFGRTYIKTNDINLQVDPTRVYINFDNLFDGDTDLGDKMNQLLNDDWKDLYEEFHVSFIVAMKTDFIYLIDSFFKDRPYNDFFTTANNSKKLI